MIIKGANLEDTEVEFSNLGDINYFDDKRQNDLVRYIQDIYYSLSEQVGDVSKFPREGNKVVINPGMLNHRCSGDLDSLRNISKYGVLASEWFGVLESEMEGRFCVFISRMKGDNYPYKGDLAEDDRSRLNIGQNILLFFDENNPVMQQLLHLDYFEYENVKNNNPEDLSNYSDEERLLFDRLIEPLSPAGTDMRNNYNSKTNYWSAIPGGIPSRLVNGLCIKKNDYSEEELEELSSLFPNATIFNNNLEIVHERKKDKEEGLKI